MVLLICDSSLMLMFVEGYRNNLEKLQRFLFLDKPVMKQSKHIRNNIRECFQVKTIQFKCGSKDIFTILFSDTEVTCTENSVCLVLSKSCFSSLCTVQGNHF